MADNAQSIQTVGKARESWSEVMFWLAFFFGLLHFGTLAMQVTAMFFRTALGRELSMPMESSMLLGHTYLAFLAAYVGQKEFTRWFKRGDDEILSEAESRKIGRGIWIMIVWAAFFGLVLVLQSARKIMEVPQTLIYTMGEIVALLCGTKASQYLRGMKAEKKQDASNTENFGPRAIDYCKEKGKIDNNDCQLEFGLSKDQSYRLLNSLAKSGKLKAEGLGRYRVYKPA
jgi:hypothetical protein